MAIDEVEMLTLNSFNFFNKSINSRQNYLRNCLYNNKSRFYIVLYEQ